ncbi:hypothetical protein FNAPI_14058 [Fusarium napiforme]|uniref:Uncharacterized protein n=1 Tax=Fusarium napiforme TaxID=42672 RepID=A0A8H5I2K2_9HYPO|nr:hypothetical protein FNAPI_14058 [Fusarium napiforme]
MTPDNYPVYKVKSHMALPDPHMPPGRFHHAIFVETSNDDSGTLYHVTGDVTSTNGMSYESRESPDPAELEGLYSKELLVYTGSDVHPEQWIALLATLPTPPQQKASNPKRQGRVEPFKEKVGDYEYVFYNDGSANSRSYINPSRWNALRRCLSKKLNADDVAFLELFSRILIGRDNYPDEISRGIEEGIKLEWEDVYDFVNPFGDARGRAFNTVWTIDLDKDVLILTKHDRLCSAPLSLARDRLLTLDDFEILKSPTEAITEEALVSAPYLDLQPKFDPREKAFLGRILRDFGQTWRHPLRREMNDITFMKLAYAVVWILNLDFTVVERMGFDHVGGRGGPYVGVTDLPQWDATNETTVRVGTCWFTLARDIPKGLKMIREHMETHATIDGTAKYAILTLSQIVCCEFQDDELVYTRPDPLFSDTPLSDSAINLILWASDLHQAEPKTCQLNHLPVEIQDRVLRQATASSVSAAKLGVELALGPPFSWTEQGRKIKLEEVRRHRTEISPVESQIFLDGVMSGLSYKCETAPSRLKVDMSSLPAPPRSTVAAFPPKISRSRLGWTGPVP